MTASAPQQPKRFAVLARELGLSPSSATRLTILARHPDRSDTRVQQLMAELDGAALQVAQLLVGEPLAQHPEGRVDELARLLRTWRNSTQGAPPAP